MRDVHIGFLPIEGIRNMGPRFWCLVMRMHGTFAVHVCLLCLVFIHSVCLVFLPGRARTFTCGCFCCMPVKSQSLTCSQFRQSLILKFRIYIYEPLVASISHLKHLNVEQYMCWRILTHKLNFSDFHYIVTLALSGHKSTQA